MSGRSKRVTADPDTIWTRAAFSRAKNPGSAGAGVVASVILSGAKDLGLAGATWLAASDMTRGEAIWPTVADRDIPDWNRAAENPVAVSIATIQTRRAGRRANRSSCSVADAAIANSMVMARL
jgi:hypothetical protein